MRRYTCILFNDYKLSILIFIVREPSDKDSRVD